MVPVLYLFCNIRRKNVLVFYIYIYVVILQCNWFVYLRVWSDHFTLSCRVDVYCMVVFVITRCTRDGEPEYGITSSKVPNFCFSSIYFSHNWNNYNSRWMSDMVLSYETYIDRHFINLGNSYYFDIRAAAHSISSHAQSVIY
jgi:hypothetical protein